MILIQNINIIRKNGIFMKTNYANYPKQCTEKTAHARTKAVFPV